MHQLSRIAALLAMVTLLAGTLSTLGAADKDITIKDVMNKAHKGGDSLKAKLAKQLKSADKVDWDEVTTEAKELVTLGAAMSKCKPPKGEQESWDKLTKAYTDNAKALLTAAEKKDQKAAAAAVMTLDKSCGACHSAHKGK